MKRESIQKSKDFAFATIVGPVSMGKTQFAFSLARVVPVFYFTMTYSEFMQSIYEAFLAVSIPLRDCLRYDIKKLESSINSLDSDKIVSMASHIGFKVLIPLGTCGIFY